MSSSPIDLQEQERLKATVPGDPNTVMERWGSNRASEYREEEYVGSIDRWSSYYGDIDGDGDIDGVAVYGMTQGGNSVYQHIAVFLNNGSRLVYDAEAELGTRGTWMLSDLTSIESGQILANTIIWRDEDASCCPTGDGMIQLDYGTGSLVIAYLES